MNITIKKEHDYIIDNKNLVAFTEKVKIIKKKSMTKERFKDLKCPLQAIEDPA